MYTHAMWFESIVDGAKIKKYKLLSTS